MCYFVQVFEVIGDDRQRCNERFFEILKLKVSGGLSMLVQYNNCVACAHDICSIKAI